jgi:hypothetical protein
MNRLVDGPHTSRVFFGEGNLATPKFEPGSFGYIKILNLLAPEFGIKILAHPVCKM